ncbi:Transposase DDE domain-containing protein [Bacillus sp. 71mf]|nr:Transposase DDE domain-containing protein [Bacillus sp. 71mf]SFT02257.1 Transposase DDE domain-containing protein [Bacillus sp. 103mf]
MTRQLEVFYPHHIGRLPIVELSFAHSKKLHGLRYARYRGVQKVKAQVLMTAIIQNLKKWTKLRSLKQVGLHLTNQIIEETTL